MILAAPLVIPFAEAVGISIATLGMAKAADMVNDYIQENPEESMKILSTIVPNIGIGQIFANKEDSDDEEVEVEEDTRSKKEIVLGELAKDKGNYSDEDAEGNYASKRGRIIRALEDAGKVNPDKEYNPEKKYQGYKRFIRPKKADGGAIGIEVLFGPKVPAAPSQLVSESDILLGYRGDAAYRSGSEQSKSIGQGNVGSKASFGGGQGRDRSGRSEGAGGVNPNQYTSKQQNVNQIKANLGIKDPNLLQKTFNKYNSLPIGVKGAINTMAPVELMKLFNIGNALNTGYDQIKRPVLTDEDILLEPSALPELTLGMTPQVPTNMQVAELSQKQLDFLNSPKIQRDLKEFGRDPKAVFDMLPNYEEKPFFGTNQEPTTPQEYNEYLDSIGVPRMTAADGGRVGLFMGGSPLDGQALSIYNSMNAYGFSDQEIANALQEQGLYDPNASTPDPTPDPGQSGSQSGGRGSDQDVGYVDRQDYSFNKKNYAPGEQLEINPAAFGVSFPDQPSAPKREGIINQAIDSFTSLPTRSLSSFSSPTTGGNIIGPAEQGFMGQTLDIDPANRTREEIRSLYDNYNRFLGRTSNFADARQKGKAGQVLGSLVGAAYGIPFVGPVIEMFTNAFGPRGDKSLQSKYTVDGVGFGNTGARDEFGLATFNKKDGFLGLTGDTTRDYTDRMNERLGELTDFFGSRIEGFDINNLDAETLDKMKDINSFYTKQIQAYKQRTAVEDINKKTQDAIEAQRIQRELEEAAKAKSKAAALAAIQKQGQASYNPNIHGPTNYGRDSQGNQSFDFGGGFGIGSDGGPVSNKTGRGRTGYGNGGLATMFKEKR